MIGVIVTMIVCIAVGIAANIQYKREINKIKALEQMLDEFYKRREQRLMAEDKRTTIENSVRGGSKPVVRINGNDTLKSK